MRILAIAAATALMVPTVASADAPKPSKDPNELVCKGQTRPNSRFKDKTCRTRAEWDQIREAAKRDAKEWLDQPTINTDRTD